MRFRPYVAIARIDHWPKNAFMLLGVLLAIFYRPDSLTLNTIAYKRIDAYTVEYTSKADGKVTTIATRSVSKDGKTLTERAKGTNTQGQAVNNLRIWKKQ